MRIAHFGTFDVDNYGDLLFPHIAEWRLPFAKILHVSPAGGSTVFRDSLPAVTMAEVSDQKPDAVIVGGGNIVHLRANTLREYREISTLAYPSLSVGAAELAEKNNVPLIFNGPSIPITHLNLVERRFLGRAIRNASCLAVRDAVSLTLAESLGADPRPFLVAVMMAASAAFATPFGYQTNVLVYNMAGYSYLDFVRVGLPLNLVTWSAAMFAIPAFFPF